MTTTEQIQDLYNNNVRKVKVTYSHGGVETIRLFKSTYGDICRFKKGSSRKGYPIGPFSNIVKVEQVIVKSQKTDEQKWIDSLNKIKTRLVNSGLWEHLVKEIDEALTFGYNVMQDMNTHLHMRDREEELKYFKEHYPKLVLLNTDGKEYINMSFIWMWYKIPKVEKMRFYKYNSSNDFELKRIAEKMLAKETHHARGDYQYDISFEYNAEKKRAWYSKEYRGCGNGYYYLALDATHAMFSEKD